MCGIFCELTNENCECKHILNDFQEALCKRGPDFYGVHTDSIYNIWNINFAASVLWMQGNCIEQQPMVCDNGNVLLWNGDIFYGELASDGTVSDTNILFKELSMASPTSDHNVLSVMSKVRGPYAFIYWDNLNKNLWFGRDRIGRHSLLWSMSDQNGFVISSVAKRNSLAFNEVPSVGLFVINVLPDKGYYVVNLNPWSDIKDQELQQVRDTFPFIKIENENIQSPLHSNILQVFENRPTESDLLTYSSLQDVQTVKVMDVLLRNSEIKERVVQLISALKNSVEIRIKKKPNICQFCLKNHYHSQKPDNQCSNTLSCGHSKIGVLFSGGLDSAVLAALVHCYVSPDDSIDLLNIAFEKKKNENSCKKVKKECHKEMSEKNFNVPDRITGRQTFEELSKLYPKRKWKFIEDIKTDASIVSENAILHLDYFKCKKIDLRCLDLRKKVNITQEELCEIRNSRITDLIYPLNTILDDSLGCALWFASRGEGTAFSSDGEISHHYVSPARVLLLGMGADEQLGGYMRHRTTLKHHGWDALQDELRMEISRISSRNLGRDDRIVSDHGRQCRYPYLDESVVSLLASLPVWHKCYPTSSMPPGIGDKLLLRLAAWELGLKKAAGIPKRAFQFGSRIANSKEKASDVSYRL